MQSSPPRWPYAGIDHGTFRIHDRALFSISVVFTAVLIAILIYLYTRWVCRFDSSSPLATYDAVHLSVPQSSPRRGLDLAEITKLPLVVYSNLAADGGKFYDLECCICLGSFADKETVKILPKCRHSFHSECLDKWLKTRSSCPLCRASLRFDLPV